MANDDDQPGETNNLSWKEEEGTPDDERLPVMQGGIRGVQDLAFTVPDLAQACEFFASFFGAEVLAECGPAADSHRSSMRAFMNADVRAEIQGCRLLRTPFLNLKLIEASLPGGRGIWPAMLDIGGWHLAGYVDDIDEAMEFLESSDVYILGPGKKPTTNPPEVGEGSYACHCMTGWGFHFELLSYPNGRAYMADFPIPLWNPAQPDRGATSRAPSRPSVPGFRGFEHLSFAVADIEESSAFLEDVLGCERFYDMGPMSDPHGSGFGAYANVDVRVSVSRVRLFRTPFFNLELIEPEFPGQNRAWPGLLDVGGWQLVFNVEDIDEAEETMRKSDVHVLGGKRKDAPGAGENQVRLSCLTPFGLHFELVEGPPVAIDGLAAWHPAHPDL
jgi:catechol 2,3-dioxygenase-like lactoylglutathione lyase family enzyme